MHAASFKHSLLPVDMDVCMACPHIFQANLSETKGDNRRVPNGSL